MMEKRDRPRKNLEKKRRGPESNHNWDNYNVSFVRQPIQTDRQATKQGDLQAVITPSMLGIHPSGT